MATWLGGGNNRANNAKDWSSNSAPQAGDTLILPPNSTVNIWGNDLAGDTLKISPVTPYQSNPPGVTIALSHNAVANIEADSGYVGQVYISVQGQAALKLTQIPTLVGHSRFGMPIDVWLSKGAALTGTLAPTASTFSLTGDLGSTYTNSGTDTFSGAHATIAVDVLGIGTMQVFATSTDTASLSFEASVSAGQTVEAQGAYSTYAHNWFQGVLELANPDNFFGTAEILDHGTIQIDNREAAASWRYADNELTLRDANGAVIGKTNLISNDPNQPAHGLAVRLSHDTGVMSITAGTGFSGTV